MNVISSRPPPPKDGTHEEQVYEILSLNSFTGQWNVKARMVPYALPRPHPRRGSPVPKSLSVS